MPVVIQTILTTEFPGFSQSLEKNAGIVLRDVHCRLRLKPLKFVIRPSISFRSGSTKDCTPKHSAL